MTQRNLSPGRRSPSSQEGPAGQAPVRRTLENTYRTTPAERFRASVARQVMLAVLERYLAGNDPRPALELVLGAGYETATPNAESRAAPQTPSQGHHSKHATATRTGSAKSQKMAEQLHAEKSAEGLRAREKSGIAGGDGGAESTLKELKSIKDKRVKKEKRADEGDEESKPTEKGQSEGSEKPASKSSSVHNLKISEEVRPLTSEADAAPDKSPSKSIAATSKQVSQSDASDRRESSREPSPDEARISVSRRASPHRRESASREASPQPGVSSREASPAGGREFSSKLRHPEASPQRQFRPSATLSKRSSFEMAGGRLGPDRLSVPSVVRPIGSPGAPAVPVALDWTRLMPRLCVRLADIIRREVALVTPARC